MDPLNGRQIERLNNKIPFESRSVDLRMPATFEHRGVFLGYLRSERVPRTPPEEPTLTPLRLLPSRQSVTWEPAPLSGTPPEPRSGHTFAVVGTKAYLFGGVGRKNGACIERNTRNTCGMGYPRRVPERPGLRLAVALAVERACPKANSERSASVPIGRGAQSHDRPRGAHARCLSLPSS